MSNILNAIHVSTAGLGPLILQFGVVGLLAVGLLAAAWFSPVFKQAFFGAAVVTIGALFFMVWGVHSEAARCKKQEVVREKAIDTAVGNAVTHANSKRVRNGAKVYDKWDSNQY